MSILALTLAIAVSLLLVAIITLSPWVWLALAAACVALSVAVAKSGIKSTSAKLGLAVAGSIAVVALVLVVKVAQFYELEVGGPVREARQAQEAFDMLLASPDPQRFSKALQVAQSLGDFSRRQAMLWDLHRAMSDLSGSTHLDESEFAAAVMAAGAINACPDFLPTVLVRQMQPADLVQTLHSMPSAISCGGRDQQLIGRVIERCAGPWRTRCADELPLQGLLEEANAIHPDEPKHLAGQLTARAWAIRELVKSVWPGQPLDR